MNLNVCSSCYFPYLQESIIEKNIFLNTVDFVSYFNHMFHNSKVRLCIIIAFYYH